MSAHWPVKLNLKVETYLCCVRPGRYKVRPAESGQKVVQCDFVGEINYSES